MPANVVKTPEDERLWNKAKAQAEKQGRGGDYAYIMGIFQRMKGNKSEADKGCDTPGEKKRSGGMGQGQARGGGKGPMGVPVGLKKAFIIPGRYKTERIPGQVPQKRDEAVAALHRMPKPFNAAMLLNHTDPMLTPGAIVKGLGFSATRQGDWTKFLEEKFQTSVNEVVLRKAIMEKAILEGQDPAVRRAILQRSLVHWRERMQKSMVSIVTPDELLKAKYKKRWKGKDGKWHYEYEDAKPKKPAPGHGTVRKFPEYHDKKYEPADPEYNRKEGESMDDYIERLKKLDAKKSLAKAEPRGGKYHRRIPSKSGKGYRYIYKPEDYDKREDKHVSGEDASKAYLSGKVSKCVAMAGKKGCGPEAFGELVKKYGKKSVAQVLKDSVNGGKLAFKKGKFYAKETSNG